MKRHTERRSRRKASPYTALLERSPTLMHQERALQRAIEGFSRLTDDAFNEVLHASRAHVESSTERRFLQALAMLDPATFFEVVDRYERLKRGR